MSVDTSSPEGRDLVTRIITADGPDSGLFITNLRVPGLTDHDTLAAHRPDLISVTLAGDRHGRPAVDYTVNPALGIPDITGPEGHDDPVAHAVPAWDLLAGQMVVSSLLGAERHRLRHGEGQAVDLTLKDVAAAMIGHLGLIGDAALNPEQRAKSGNALYGAYGQDFVCACGGRVMVIGLTKRQWSLLVKATETGEQMDALERHTGQNLADEGVRWTLRHEITEILKPWFGSRRIDSFAAEFDKMGLTWSRFRTTKEALAEDPDLSPANPMFSHLHQPGIGSFPVPGYPAEFGAMPRSSPKPAPELGADTEQVLVETGLDAKEIARLFDRGVVTSPAYSARNAA